MNYERIKDSVDIELLQNSHVVVVGAGGAKQLILNLARTGIGRLTVLDFDTVEDTNLVRQGYNQSDIGLHKVDAIGSKVQAINPFVDYEGITHNFLSMETDELDRIFQRADLLLFLTDSFDAQRFGNILALRYMKPAIWGGWYAKSRTAEIFFQVPDYTPGCFRCAVSSRYIANEKKVIPISSQCNTIFHSELLDSYLGFLALGILHRNRPDDVKECSTFFKGLLNEDGTLDWNFLHLKVHPHGGHQLFDTSYDSLGKRAQNFVPCWQKVEPELRPKYNYDCPDCKGILHELTLKTKSNEK
ncbi:MAG: ThiF family adenylyltransferase [Bacteroidota bacterium]